MADEKQREKRIELPRTSFPFAGILIAIPLITAFFYGVVGEDKFLLLSPMSIAGYAMLAGWILWAAFSRKAVAVTPPAFYPFLAFVVYGAILTLYCPIAYEAKVRVLIVGLVIGAYYVWGNTLTHFRNNRWILGLLIAFALFTSLYGLVNHFKAPDQVLWTTRYFVYEGRLASTYICPNHFAHLLQMLLPFCLVLLFIPRAGMFLRLLAGYSILIYIPTIYFTESRAGMLGAVLAAGVTALLLALRRSRKLFLLLIVLVPLFSTILFWGGWRYSEMFKRRMTPVVEFLTEAKEEGFANTGTSDFRPLTWLDSLEMVKDKPVTGFGPGSYRYTFPEYRNRFRGTRIVTGHPHNEYLEIASEYGFVGFGLFAIAWSWGLIRLFRFSLKTSNQHHAFMAMAFIGTTAGTMLHSFFDFQMHVFQNALIFAMLAGIAVGPMCGRRQEEVVRKEKEARTGAMRWIRVGLAVVTVTGAVIAFQTFSSAFIRAVADNSAIRGQTRKAERYYQTAIRIDSSNWLAYKGFGELVHDERYYTLEMEIKKQLAVTERDILLKGYEYNPMDAELAMNLGETTYFLGDHAGGIELMKHAAAMRPFNDTYWWTLGVTERKAGRYEDALESFRYTASIRDSISTRRNIEWLQQQLDKRTSTQDDAESTSVSGQEDIPTVQDLYDLMDTF